MGKVEEFFDAITYSITLKPFLFGVYIDEKPKGIAERTAEGWLYRADSGEPPIKIPKAKDLAELAELIYDKIKDR